MGLSVYLVFIVPILGLPKLMGWNHLLTSFNLKGSLFILFTHPHVLSN